MHHPFLIIIAEWAWSTDPSPQVTPTVCLASLPFLSSPCFMRLLAKLIGISIIAASCINKGKDRLSLSFVHKIIIVDLSTENTSLSTALKQLFCLSLSPQHLSYVTYTHPKQPSVFHQHQHTPKLSFTLMQHITICYAAIHSRHMVKHSWLWYKPLLLWLWFGFTRSQKWRWGVWWRLWLGMGFMSM